MRTAKNELIASSLASREGIRGLEAWRGIDKEGKATRSMRKFFDASAAYDAALRREPNAREALTNEVKKSLGEAEPGTQLTRYEELARLFLAKKLGEALPESYPEVRRIFDSLSRVASSEGEVDAAELFTSSNVSLGTKAAWFNSQLLSGVKFLERRDIADAKKKAEEKPPEELLREKESAPDQNLPPPASDRLKPSMEELERSKEGEPGAYFTIAPYYGGYYRDGDYETWNAKTLAWERGKQTLKNAEDSELQENSRRVMAGTVRPEVDTALSMPYGFRPDKAKLKIHGNGKITVREDGRGSFVLTTTSEKPVSFLIEIGREVSPKNPEVEKAAAKKIETGKLSKETESKLEEIAKTNGTAMDKARSLKAYVKKLLTYSNDSAMNAVYRGGNPNGYFKRIEEAKKADCDVANTYFAALLSRLDIPVRMVSGHYVKSKNQRGNAVISSGTGHAWVEVFDGSTWQRLDATPPGDPNMDDEETDEAKDDFVFEGDFGEEDAKEISDEELEKMIEEAKANLDKKERVPEKRSALRFAEDAGCTPEEAREILKQIEAARELRDRRGRKIRDRIVSEFQKIIKENRVERLRYKAPVRLSDAHELADPVEAMLDIDSGESDPGGFARYEGKVEIEQLYGGFDVVFIVDKSGSMGETDPKTGQPKWREQQKFVFVFMDALYFVAQEFKRERIKLISPLDIRSGLVSFQSGKATVELPLGSKWGPQEQYKVWKALQQNVGGGTPDHLGLNATQEIIKEDMAAYPKEKNRLRLALVSADGGSDNTAATMQSKEALKSIGVVVKAAGIGVGARQVEATYLPDGKNLEGFDSVPDWASEEVISEAKKLFPRKVKR